MGAEVRVPAAAAPVYLTVKLYEPPPVLTALVTVAVGSLGRKVIFPTGMGSVTPVVPARGLVAVRVKTWVTVAGLRSTFKEVAAGLVKVTTGRGVASTGNTTAGLKLPVLPWLSTAQTLTEALPVKLEA